jgi:hypothetical protein
MLHFSRTHTDGSSVLENAPFESPNHCNVLTDNGGKEMKVRQGRGPYRFKAKNFEEILPVKKNSVLFVQ